MLKSCTRGKMKKIFKSLKALLAEKLGYERNANEMSICVRMFGGWLNVRYIYRDYNEDKPCSFGVMYFVRDNFWKNGSNVAWALKLWG